MDAPRTLAAHITEALIAQARRILARVPDDAAGRALRERLTEWYEDVDERLDVEIHLDRPGKGRRLDTRSTMAVVFLRTAHGRGELLRVRVRDLVDRQGRRIDARATARDLLAQLTPAPDDISTLEDL